MPTLRINKKYIYFEDYIKPKESNFNSVEDFLVAKSIYSLHKRYGHLVNIEALNFTMTRGKKRSKPLNRICVGSKVKVLRWDGNGTPSEVTVTNIIPFKDYAKVYTDEGYFIFSKENCQKDNIDFFWTSQNRSWEKEYQCWIDGSWYYLKEDYE
jgi:hypothetical protein